MSARRCWSLPLAATLALVVGCDGGTSSKKPAAAGGKKGAVTAEEAQPRDILNKTTFDVRSVAQETQKGARVIDPTTNPNMYVAQTARLAVMTTKHNLDIYQAANGDYPKTAQELVDNLLKPEGQGLPALPYYLEYGYDETEHKLVILEYPERKKERERRRDAE
ncbi:MAG TPA: hypothetical protein VG406_08040 [Isosphaeraceae bacterium]|jgi:hypothetical protein|nr:hypothetical protein [Isosphaeraceae bacterium]